MAARTQSPEAVLPTVQDAIKSLQEILDCPEIVQKMESLGATTLSGVQQDRLATLYRALCGRHRRNDDAAHTGRKRRGPSDLVGSRRKRTAPAKEHSMSRLTHNLHLDDDIARLIDDPSCGTDAVRFLGDVEKLDADTNDLISLSDWGGIFALCYDYMKQLAQRNTQDMIRIRFFWLMMFDMVRLLNPGYTGRRFGKDMQAGLRSFIGQVFNDEEEKIQKVCEDVDGWSRLGLKVSQLCDEFGEGSIVFLARHLSEDFLKNKYRESGDQHDAVFAELHRLQLKERAVQTGATELGRNIRRHLIRGLEEGFQDVSQEFPEDAFENVPEDASHVDLQVAGDGGDEGDEDDDQT